MLKLPRLSFKIDVEQTKYAETAVPVAQNEATARKMCISLGAINEIDVQQHENRISFKASVKNVWHRHKNKQKH